MRARLLLAVALAAGCGYAGWGQAQAACSQERQLQASSCSKVYGGRLEDALPEGGEPRPLPQGAAPRPAVPIRKEARPAPTLPGNGQGEARAGAGFCRRRRRRLARARLHVHGQRTTLDLAFYASPAGGARPAIDAGGIARRGRAALQSAPTRKAGTPLELMVALVSALGLDTGISTIQLTDSIRLSQADVADYRLPLRLAPNRTLVLEGGESNPGRGRGRVAATGGPAAERADLTCPASQLQPLAETCRGWTLAASGRPSSFSWSQAAPLPSET